METKTERHMSTESKISKVKLTKNIVAFQKNLIICPEWDKIYKYEMNNPDIEVPEFEQTFLNKYGCEHSSQNKEIKNKVKQTNIKKFGVEYAIQNPEFYEKILKSSLKIKYYKDTNLYYQGSYELDFLNKYYSKIIIERCFSIKYLYQKNKIYYPDFYLPEYNLVVEIKSKWWFEKHLERNLEKQKQCLDDGYNFLFITDKNYEEFDKILNFPFCS